MKIYMTNLLAIANAVGTAVIFIALFNLTYKIDQELMTAHGQTSKAVNEVQKTEKEEISILRCQFALFGEDRMATVSVAQLDSCIKGTSLDTQAVQPSTSAPSSSAGTPIARSTATLPIVSVPRANNTDQPTSTEPTISGPPDPSTSGTTSPPPTIPVTPPQPTTAPLLIRLISGLLKPIGLD